MQRESNAQSQTRIPQLDGLRGIAIGMVLVWHFFLVPMVVEPRTFLAYVTIPGRLAWTGVDLFFVLSGFLIGGILLDARDASNYFTVFYTRRFFRIIPVYFLCFGGIFVLSIFLGNLPVRKFDWVFADHLPWLSFPFFFQNFWMAARSTLGSFGLGATWSLCVEEQFYLTLPLLARLLNRRQFTIAVLVGITLAPALRLLFHALWPTHFLSWFVIMPCRADALLLGVLASIAVRNPDWKNWLVAKRRLFHLLAPFLLAVLAFLSVKGANFYTYPMLSFGMTVVAISFAVLLLYAVLFAESIVSRILCFSWLRWLGTIAYGTYLFHEFVYAAVYWAFFGRQPRVASLAEFLVALLGLAVSLTLCRLLWLKFEKPLIAIGHRRGYAFQSSTPILQGAAAQP
jgi:peptidoglycan/LPS O-acetylase OafA/YrhL